MPDGTRFFLGYGERLTSRIAAPGGGAETEPAYSFDEAVARLTPMLQDVASTLAALPDLAAPRDEVVGVMTLHPQWMAKTSHPQQLLNSYDLRQVGSRPVAVTPDRWTRQDEPAEMASSELYVAGARSAFESWARDLEELPGAVSPQIRRLESVRAPVPTDRVRGGLDDTSQDNVLLEVVLHASEDASDEYILAAFGEYAQSLGARAVFDRRLYAGGLCFLPVQADPEVIDDLALFAFLRVARPMPRLRQVPSLERSVSAPSLAPASLPDEDAVDPDLRIAVFDGGLHASTHLGRWATSHEGSQVGAQAPTLLVHGHDVTSAFLFGPLVPGLPAPRPYAVIDHYRVLDQNAQTDPYELYEVLRRIDDVLRTRRYGMFNLSIGPFLPVEDDEVHPWDRASRPAPVRWQRPCLARRRQHGRRARRARRVTDPGPSRLRQRPVGRRRGQRPLRLEASRLQLPRPRPQPRSRQARCRSLRGRRPGAVPGLRPAERPGPGADLRHLVRRAGHAARRRRPPCPLRRPDQRPGA